MVKSVGWSGLASLAILSAFLLLPAAVEAADPIGSFSISGRLGISGYDMGDVNNGISRSNHLMAANPLSEEWDLPERIHLGFDFIGDASYDLSPWLRVGLLYQRTTGKTSVDFLHKISVSPESGMIIPRAFVRLPWRPMDDMSLRAFGGLVFLRGAETTIEHEKTSENLQDRRTETLTVEGSGTGVLGGLAGEYTLSDRFALSFEAGYRIVKAGFDNGSYSIDVYDPGGDSDRDGIPDGRDPSDTEGSYTSYLWGFLNGAPGRQDEEPTVREDLDADFSGAFVQIGMRIYIF